jgi:hypothetical protein
MFQKSPAAVFKKRNGPLFTTYTTEDTTHYPESRKTRHQERHLKPKFIAGGMAHNVPAVCDGLAARIRKCAAFPGPTNCAGAMAWEWSEAE